MGNYHGPVCRLCRREGQKLFLKGEKCMSNCTFDKRNGVLPGQHGLARRRKVSDYGLQLRAKQRARRLYGVQEAQFRHYFEKAERAQGVTGTVLLQQLERRLDNIVYRLGMAASRPEARQLVSHRHFAVNGRTVNIASYQVRPGDIVSVREGHKDKQPIENALALIQGRPVPDWLTLDAGKKQGTILRYPERHEMDQFIDEQLIVEYYSR
ncbi:MAG TPA: 30S ribosomal protein S4 [Candidatus Dormibacteraeota bacterium]|jgi:small subunit ribosomal protein S4|nr:30S ribosomal protein S4 [Candidatus Dormibacteraeota bacterium]